MRFLPPVGMNQVVVKTYNQKHGRLNPTESHFFHHHGENLYTDSSDIIWALKGVSFEIRKGEVVGIIGRNGAFGSDQVLNVVSLTQAEYDAGTPLATTLYLII